MGVHAGGLIISNSPLPELVPLVKRKENPQASAWVEGLHGQDLQPVGLVKFDLLVISNLLQIAKCCELVKSRHGLKGICALEGQVDWSDVDAWRNDTKALEMANIGDLKGIFQFDSETVREMCRSGGVDRFEDLVAYTSLNRPGPLNMKMQERYIERKRGREQYSLHSLLEPILGDTYGVMIYQEQVMKILNVVGEIPLKDCELVRKAISKKKIENFIKYKEMFILNGQRNLEIDEKEINHLWDQVEAFSEYGFNKSMHQDTYIPTANGLKKICDFQKGDRVYCIDEQGNKVETDVVGLHNHGVLDGYKVIFDDGYEVICTIDHKFLTKDGQASLREILSKDVSVFCEKEYGGHYAGEKKRRLGSEVQEEISQQKFDVSSSKNLQYLFEHFNSNRELELSLQGTFPNKKTNEETSENVRRVPETRLGRRKNLQISLPTRISKNGFKRQSPENLRRLRKNKKRKYQSQKLKNESIRGTSQNILRNGTKNVCKTRNSTATCRAFEGLERRESRKICKMYRSCVEKPKEIKNGNLVAIPIKMEFKESSLRKKIRSKMETSRFGYVQNLDRSRRVLSFFRTPKQQGSRGYASTSCSTKRHDVERRVFKKKRYNVGKSGYVMLSQQHRKNDFGVVDCAPQHAPITNTGGLVSRKIIRVVPVGKHQMYDLEVANRTHNFILPNGIVTSNSHAVAYSYVSAYLLYLKSHYPNEFYTSILSCETLSDKIKEYKMEAKLHKVNVLPVDINRSKINFDLQGEDIYFGLSNVKGIGEAPAKRIMDLQPFSGFEDFLERFGTDASVLKPLLGLRCFKESDPVTLWKFAEHYKSFSKKNEDKRKRYLSSLEKYEEDFKILFPEETMVLSDIKEDSPHENPYWQKYNNEEDQYVEKNVECEQGEEGSYSKVVDGTIELDCGLTIEKEIVKYYKKVKVKRNWNRLAAFKSLWNKRKKSIEKFNLISKDAPKLLEFDASNYEIDKKLEDEFNDLNFCENKYYGFNWIHPLENSPDYRGGFTFNDLKAAQDIAVGVVEIKVLKANKTKSKKGTEYYQVVAEDVTGQSNKIIVWQDDWLRWENELSPDNLLRIRLHPPSNGFFTFTLESNRANFKRRDSKKYSEKKEDIRIVVLRSGESK
jgi:hypothetical protein